MTGKTTHIVLCAALGAILVVAQAFAGSGTNSGEFLRLPTSSRGSSLGGAYVAVAEGAGALYYNTAGLARTELAEFSVSHTELYQDLRLESISFTTPLGSRFGLGIAATYLGYGGIAGFDRDGNSTGDLSASSTVLTIGLARKLSDVVSLGVAVKPVFEELAGYSAKTVTIDLGVAMDWGRLSFGAQYANLGGGLEYISEKPPLPRTFRVGMAYKSLGGASTIAIAASGVSGGLTAEGGLEYCYNENLTLRGSYCSTLVGDGAGVGALGIGIGLKLSPVRLDYSYRPAAELDESHQITATFQFGE